MTYIVFDLLSLLRIFNFYDNDLPHLPILSNLIKYTRLNFLFKTMTHRKFRGPFKPLLGTAALFLFQEFVQKRISLCIHTTYFPLKPSATVVIFGLMFYAGKPKPRVQWYSTDDTVISSFDTGTLDFENKQSFGNDHDREGTTIKKLVINNLNRSHANSTYTCLAGNNDNDADSSLRKSVLINMYCEYNFILCEHKLYIFTSSRINYYNNS